MPYICVENSKYWKQRRWNWDGLERMWFDPAKSNAPESTFQWDSSTQKWVRYNVRARLRGTKLRIEYHKVDNHDNPDLAEYEIIYGVHILTIENGATHGPSVWHADGEPKSCVGPGWRLEAISGGGRRTVAEAQYGQYREDSKGNLDNNCSQWTRVAL